MHCIEIQQRKGIIMSAKNRKQNEKIKEIKIVSVKKGLEDNCVYCTAKAQGMNESELDTIFTMGSKAGLQKLKEIAPKLSERTRTRWNRVMIQVDSNVHDVWMCTECKRVVNASKSTLPEIFPADIASKLKK